MADMIVCKPQLLLESLTSDRRALVVQSTVENKWWTLPLNASIWPKHHHCGVTHGCDCLLWRQTGTDVTGGSGEASRRRAPASFRAPLFEWLQGNFSSAMISLLSMPMQRLKNSQATFWTFLLLPTKHPQREFMCHNKLDSPAGD